MANAREKSFPDSISFNSTHFFYHVIFMHLQYTNVFSIKGLSQTSFLYTKIRYRTPLVITCSINLGNLPKSPNSVHCQMSPCGIKTNQWGRSWDRLRILFIWNKFWRYLNKFPHSVLKKYIGLGIEMKEDMYLILKKGGFTSGTHKKTYRLIEAVIDVQNVK